MEPSILSRIAQALRQQESSLRAWLSSTPPQVREIQLGGRATAEVEEHLHVLGDAIAKAEHNELGICTVCHEPVGDHYLQTDYTHSVCLEHLSAPERSKLEAELELSVKVQQGLLPHAVPIIDGWEVAAFSQPASIVGGDYFDFLRFSDGAHAIIIADVMGKGLPASLLMASLQASLRIIVPESAEPHEVLHRLNRIFLHNTQLTKFVTIVVLRIEAGKGIIRYANGGHHPPLLVGTTRTSRAHLLQLRPTGAAIGLVERATFTTEAISVEPGESLFLYTDGLVEARDTTREEFGDERLRATLSDYVGFLPSSLVREVRQRLATFTGDGPLFDDTTLLAVRRSMS